MTVRGLDRAALEGHTAVAVIPATDNIAWATNKTWSVARSAAATSHRVALVDLSVQRPVLESGAVRTSEEGIVDAFVYDASLTRIAQPQDVPGLHFLGVGSPTVRPQEIWGNPRWEKLANGFKSQGALLLLFVPPQAVPHLALRPDGLIVLAPEGLDPAGPMFHGLEKWLNEGVPLLGVLTEDTPAPPEPSTEPTAEPDTTPTHRARSTGTRWNPATWNVGTRRWVFGMVVMVGLVAGAWAVIRNGGTTSLPAAEPSPPPAAVSDDAAQPEPPTAAAAADSLFYSIQVAAFNTWDRALQHATDLESASLPAAVTPVRLGSAVWYRVLMGALLTSTHADSALRGLWADGLVEADQGTILRTPQAFDLGMWESAAQARDEAARLRAEGIPAYTLAAPLGTRILVGAFENPDQAAVIQSLLTGAGLTVTLTTRTGNAP